MASLPLTCLLILVFACGCSSPKPQVIVGRQENEELLAKQPRIVNDLIRKYNNQLLSLPEADRKRQMKTRAMEFLTDLPPPEIGQLLASGIGPFGVDAERVPLVDENIWWEMKKYPNDAEFYYFRTNVWRLTPSMRMSDVEFADALVVAIVDEKVAGYEQRALIPY